MRQLERDGLQRALTALGLLDPPRHFTRELHRFGIARPDPAKTVAEHIHEIVDGARSDPSLTGVLQCIGELRGVAPERKS